VCLCNKARSYVFFANALKKTVIIINTTQTTVVSTRILIWNQQGRTGIKKPLRHLIKKKNPKGRQATYKRPLFGHFVCDTVKAPSTYVALPLWPVNVFCIFRRKMRCNVNTVKILIMHNKISYKYIVHYENFYCKPLNIIVNSEENSFYSKTKKWDT
jgi:hypothetical protein